MTLWPLLLTACRKEPERPPPPGACAEVGHTTFSGGEAVELDVPGCGTIRARSFEPQGDGAFAVQLFSGGDRIVVYVEAVADAVLQGLVVRGDLELPGGEAAGWGFPAGGDPGTPPGPAPAVGAWAASVSRGGVTALVGAVGGETSPATVELEEDSFVLTYGGALEVPLSGGRGVYFDPFALVLGPDPAAVWTDWAGLAASQTAAEALDPGAPAIELPASSSSDDVDDAVATWPHAAEVSFGPGWPAVPGDYEGDAASFVAVVDRARGAGRAVGVTISPFAVSPAAPVAVAHPDWFVTDPTGEPVAVDGSWVLDGTDPAALRWLAGELGRVGPVDTWFVEGLDAASAPGVRDGGLLGSLGLRDGLRELRRAVRPARVVAVGGPALTILGVTDGLRVSPDPSPEAHRAGLVARLPLAPYLPLDPGATVASGPSATAALAGAGITGTLRLALGSDPARAELAAEVAAALTSPAAPPGPGPWTRLSGDGYDVLVAPDGEAVTVPGPGGTELVTGAETGPGDRALAAGTAEIWVP